MRQSRASKCTWWHIKGRKRSTESDNERKKLKKKLGKHRKRNQRNSVYNNRMVKERVRNL